MYKIWFCWVYSNIDKFKDNYALCYEKVLYENIEKSELKEYITDLCKEYGWQVGKYFGSDNQCIELLNVDDTDKEYCLFFEEELEDDEEDIKNQIKYLEEKEKVCGFDKRDYAEMEELKSKLEGSYNE